MWSPIWLDNITINLEYNQSHQPFYEYNKLSLDTHRYILNQCMAPFVIIVSPTQINNTCLWQSFNISTKEFFLVTFTFCHPCISCLKLCLRVSLSYLTLLSSSYSTYTYLVSPSHLMEYYFSSLVFSLPFYWKT